MKKETRVHHPPRVDLPPDNHPLVAPIYQTVKFEFDTLEQTLAYLHGERRGFFYTRESNPTTCQLEMTLAELQGREDCLTTASGIGAVAHLLLGLTRQDDHIVCFVETYDPTRRLPSARRVRHRRVRSRDLTAHQNRMSSIMPGTVRLSIGLEDPDDLAEDLAQALAAAGN